MSATIGYARVSTNGQSTDTQVDRLKAAGCTVIWMEKVSGRSRGGRSELATILEFIQPGDTLTVVKLDRLGRSTRDVLNLVHELESQGAHLRVLEPEISTAGPMGKMVLTVLGMVAEMELGFIRERQRVGIEAAKAKGVYKGRPVTLDHPRILAMRAEGKGGAIRFSSLEPWPGKWIAGEGRYEGEDGRERRAGIFIGPEFGTTSRADLTAAAREASDARFDVLIACAFSYDAHASELNRLGPLVILKARMNPDLHMADELKNTGKGNLFVVFGEPDIDVIERDGGEVQVKVNGIDVFDLATGEIRSADTAGIACWFIDTDYDEESFFVRHAYFLGANDPYKALKTTLKAEIDAEAWETLYSDTSRPFARPESGRIAVKVINHFGDEVLKVIGV